MHRNLLMTMTPQLAVWAMMRRKKQRSRKTKSCLPPLLSQMLKKGLILMAKKFSSQMQAAVVQAVEKISQELVPACMF